MGTKEADKMKLIRKRYAEKIVKSDFSFFNLQFEL